MDSAEGLDGKAEGVGAWPKLSGRPAGAEARSRDASPSQTAPRPGRGTSGARAFGYFRIVHFTLLGALRSLDSLRLRSEFYRSWELALRAAHDVPLSLAQMDEPGSATLAEARNYLIEGIGKGRPAGVVAKLRPDLFPAFDQLLIDAGAGFGTLHESLRLLSEYYHRDFARMSRVRGWLAMPIVLGIAAAFVIPFPLLWDRGGPAYSFAIMTGIVAMYSLGGIPVSLVYSLADRTNRIRRPRFAWTLAMGLEGGLTFAGAARIAAATASFEQVARHLDAFAPKTLKTMTLTAMLDGSGVWPAMISQVRKADEASEYLSTLRIFASNLESPP